MDWLNVLHKPTFFSISKWLDEGTDGSYHLTDDPPTSVSYNSLICADVGLDLTNCMRPALHARLLSRCRDWPNPEDNDDCPSPAHSKEPDMVLKRRGKRRRKDVGAV